VKQAESARPKQLRRCVREDRQERSTIRGIAESPDYLTIKDIVQEAQISRSTLYNFLGRELPVTRFGCAVRIRRDDWERFKAAHRQGLGTGPEGTAA